MYTLAKVSKQANRLVVYVPKDSSLGYRDEVAIVPLKNLLESIEDSIRQRSNLNSIESSRTN